jgi:hypothetical protein
VPFPAEVNSFNTEIRRYEYIKTRSNTLDGTIISDTMD